MISQKKLIAEIYKSASSSSRQSLNTLEKYKNWIIEAHLIREIESYFLDLFGQGKMNGTIHTCIGQELSAISICSKLNEKDWVTSNHRCHGHFISKTNQWRELIDELLGLITGVSKGIGSSQHLYKSGFISNGPQGSLLPVASGIAYSKKISNSEEIVTSFVGEGTFGEGVIYEALNLSSLLGIRHLFVCENNFYSQSSKQVETISGSLEKRVEGFGLKVYETNTWDIDDLDKQTSDAIEFVRTESKPAIIFIKTYRLKAHSKGDDDRDLDEINKFHEIDLLEISYKKGLFINEFKEISDKINKYFDSALKRDDRMCIKDYNSDQIPKKATLSRKKLINERIIMSKALNNAYKNVLEKGAFFIGEDIKDPYGGAFKITKGFTNLSPKQVIGTPISEAGLVGLSIGLSLMGNRSYAEIMFGDFILNAMDQIINNACKFHHMYGANLSVPIKLRTPMGGGRGYGPTHSQSIEKTILGMENLTVCAPTSLIDPDKIISDIDKLKGPCVIIESKIDYSKQLWIGHQHLESTLIGRLFQSVLIEPRMANPEVLIIAYGRIARMVIDNYEELFIDTDTIFSVFTPQLLHPFPVNHFSQSLNNIQKVLIVEEGPECYGWADGILSKLHQQNNALDIRTLSSKAIPIPSIRSLEDEVLVSLKGVRDALIKMKNE